MSILTDSTLTRTRHPQNNAARKFTDQVLPLRERIRIEIAAALLSPLINASLLTIAERIEIRRRIRRGLSSQRWNKQLSGRGKNGNYVTQAARGRDGYSVGGRNDQLISTASMRGSRWLGADAKLSRVLPPSPPRTKSHHSQAA
jgi:hypothetical protein